MNFIRKKKDIDEGKTDLANALNDQDDKASLQTVFSSTGGDTTGKAKSKSESKATEKTTSEPEVKQNSQTSSPVNVSTPSLTTPTSSKEVATGRKSKKNRKKKKGSALTEEQVKGLPTPFQKDAKGNSADKVQNKDMKTPEKDKKDEKVEFENKGQTDNQASVNRSSSSSSQSPPTIGVVQTPKTQLPQNSWIVLTEQSGAHVTGTLSPQSKLFGKSSEPATPISSVSPSSLASGTISSNFIENSDSLISIPYSSKSLSSLIYGTAYGPDGEIYYGQSPALSGSTPSSSFEFVEEKYSASNIMSAEDEKKDKDRKDAQDQKKRKPSDTGSTSSTIIEKQHQKLGLSLKSQDEESDNENEKDKSSSSKTQQEIKAQNESRLQIRIEKIKKRSQQAQHIVQARQLEIQLRLKALEDGTCDRLNRNLNSERVTVTPKGMRITFTTLQITTLQLTGLSRHQAYKQRQQAELAQAAQAQQGANAPPFPFPSLHLTGGWLRHQQTVKQLLTNFAQTLKLFLEGVWGEASHRLSLISGKMLIVNYDNLPAFDLWLNKFVYPVTTRIVEQQQSSTGVIREIDLSRFTEILQNLAAGPRDLMPQPDDMIAGIQQVKDSLIQVGITGQAQVGTQMTGTDFLEDLSNNIQV